MRERGCMSGRQLVMVSLVLATFGLSGEASGKAPAERYVVSADSAVVADTWTKLSWQREVVAGKKSWSDAKAYCQQLTLTGKSDWRLPGVRELHSIVDYKETGATIDKVAFPEAPADFFWTSRLRAGGSSHAWSVVFFWGYVSHDLVSNVFRVRCVRGN